MPELPEVETITREMREADLEGLSITKAYVYWARSIATPNVEEFVSQIQKQKIKKIERRGKLIMLILANYTLLIHLRMTGKFIIIKNDAEVTNHERVRLILSDGRALRFEDQRKFGKWYLLANAETKLAELGIEPLSERFTLDAFQHILKNKKIAIKPFLLNQKYVTGLGNIYVDEALWEAKIHPLQPTNSLSKSEIIELYRAIPKVLQKGVDNLGTSLGAERANYFSISGRRGGNQYQLNVFRKDGDPCPRCHHSLIKIVVAQRGTHLCPICQQIKSK